MNSNIPDKGETARKRLENFSQQTRETQNKEESIRKDLENVRRRSKRLERDWRISEETRERENTE